MSLKKNFDLYCWACDFSPNRGEGILARNYIETLTKTKKISVFIKSPDGSFLVTNGKIKNLKNQNSRLNKLNFNFFENYFHPFIGICYLWVNYIMGRGLCYLNFLPLWNIFLFTLLPPKTHLGPITGFIYKKKITNLNFFLRKYLNFFLFKISLKFIYLRQNKIIFSTDLLKPLILNKNTKHTYFNYLINLINIKKKSNKKKIDVLVYNRNYSVKNNSFRNDLLDKISTLNLNICVIGNHLPLKNVKNFGFISRKKVCVLLNKTKFIINSGENPYNIFTIDAFNNHANIIYEKKLYKSVLFFNKKKLFRFDQGNKSKIFLILKNITNYKINLSLNTGDCELLKNKNMSYFNKVKINYSI